MNNHNNPHRSCIFPSTLLALALVLTLEGCITTSVNHSTSLPKVPAAQVEKPLPVPVAFIVSFTGDSWMNINAKHTELEVQAWRTALSRYTAPDHIYIAGASASPSMPEFQKFRSTHPAVEISLASADGEKSGWVQFSEGMGGLLIIEADFMSLGLLPLPLSDDMSARFSITFPDGWQESDPLVGASGPRASLEPAQYFQFTRRQWLAPMFFIPGGDEYSVDFIPPCQGCQVIELTHKDLTDWRVDEKRRLLAQYLNRIRPLLSEYARSTQAHKAAADAPVR